MTDGQTLMCEKCGKAVSERRFGAPVQCSDCGGMFHPASQDDLACDRCGDPDATRVFGPTPNRRLCQPCIDDVNDEIDDVEGEA
jgi:hypothetical protein